MNDTLPIDLSGFVTAPWGKSLLIKGNPGAGKTTLALEIIEKILSPENTVYLSTRVGDKAIYSQFPWIKELDEMNMTMNTGKKFLIVLDPRAPAGESEKNSREKRVLRTSDKKGTDGIVTDNLDSLGMDYPDLQRALETLDRASGRASALVIDSIEGICEHAEVDVSKFVSALQKDLVESSQITLVLVSEYTDLDTISPIDYLVDGIVSVKNTIRDSRVTRTLTIQKMRHMNVGFPEFFYSLGKGRFSYIPFLPGIQDIFDRNTTFKDNLFDGFDITGPKIRKIAFNCTNSGTDIVNLFLPIYISKAAKEGSGIFYVGNPETDADGMFNYFKGATGIDELESKMRVVDFNTGTSSKKHIVSLPKGKDERMREYLKSMMDLSDSFDGVLSIIFLRGFELLESSTATNESVSKIASRMSGTKNRIVFVSCDPSVTGGPHRVFDAIVNMEKRANTLFLYGLEPFTPYYGLCIKDDVAVLKMIS